MVDYLSTLAFFFQIDFWWMWETVILFSAWIIRMSRQLGADRHIVLQDTGNGQLLKIAEKWVKKGARSWGKKKGRFNIASATAYREEGLLGAHGVSFTDDLHSEPMAVRFSVIPHNPKGKGKEYSINPKVEDTEDLMGRQSVWQIMRAQATTHPEVTMLVVVGVMAALAGYVAYPYINPPHNVYVPLPPGGTVTNP